MKFCTQCQNMYYISIDESNLNELIYYCRCCGYKDRNLTNSGVTVLKTNFKNSEQTHTHMVNRFTKYDPTLPRKTNMKCPSADCTKSSDIIYLRYDDDNMKYLYICTNCDFTWKSDDNFIKKI
jgi:DNA-directed RNA polymerase subunit M/transcription elongation factor TFIIS